MKTGAAKALDPNRRSREAEDFESNLRRKVIGQTDALDKIAEIYQMFRAGLNAPRRPVGNVLLLGPTGSGKTRTVEAVAETLYGDARACLKIDCAEFQHSHEIAKLVGSPPGYLGHRETHPLITQEALNQWHTESLKLSIVLFDEIEKASDAVWRLLLGILDKAVLTLGDNRRVDLSQCIIFLTSNLGATELSTATNGFGFASTERQLEYKKIDKICQDAARRKFDPEFMNRIDKMVVYHRLTPDNLREILEIELGAVQQRILSSTGSKQFVFKCTNKVKEYLLVEGFHKEYGARHLKRVLEKNLVFPLANLVSTNQIKLGDFIVVDMPENTFTFTRESESALVPAILERFGNGAAKRPAARYQFPDSPTF